jgi:Flp pilus assembly protein TadG
MRALKGAFSRRRRTEAGYVAILVALLASVVFLGMAAMGVDTARWYVEAEQVQKAADAAALAGVTYMPNDFTNAATTAKTVAKRNGYDDTSRDVTITVAVGSKPSELKVTVSSRISNNFGGAIGLQSAVISRSAVADFTAPAPMGSPCNTFGNEPRGSTGSSAPGPVGTALPSGTSFTNCPKDTSTGTSQPQFWGAVEGPETDKVQGDRYQALRCNETGNAGATFGCSGGKNSEYENEGNYFVVHVEPGAVNNNIEVQIYDPAFVNTGSYCNGDNTDNTYTNAGLQTVPRVDQFDDNMNDYTKTGAKARYGAWKDTSGDDYTTRSGFANPGAKEYCTGDSLPSGGTNRRTSCAYPSRYRTSPCFGDPTTTTFVLRGTTETDNPKLATPISGCTKQFRGHLTQPTAAELKKGNSKYNDQLARVYHQWVSLCTFKPTKAGNYFLQVRTNAKLGGAATANTNGNDPKVYAGDSNATKVEPTLTTGAGSNSFGLRAVLASDTLRKLVSVSGWQRMPLLQNSPDSTATFNLVRALPNAKGQYLTFDFYDAADGASSGTVKVLPPNDATGSVKTSSGIPNCKYGKNSENPSTYKAASVGGTNCVVSVKGTETDGQVVHMVIPIPTDYSCTNATLDGCWFRVQMSYSGDVTDFTTWSASVGGDPVRLIE